VSEEHADVDTDIWLPKAGLSAFIRNTLNQVQIYSTLFDIKGDRVLNLIEWVS
jgi:hypothetical protein